MEREVEKKDDPLGGGPPEIDKGDGDIGGNE